MSKKTGPAAWIVPLAGLGLLFSLTAAMLIAFRLDEPSVFLMAFSAAAAAATVGVFLGQRRR